MNLLTNFRAQFFILFFFVYFYNLDTSFAKPRIIIINELPESIIEKSIIKEHFRLRFQDKNIQFGFYHSTIVQTSTISSDIYFLNLYQPDNTHIAMTFKNHHLDHLITKNIMYNKDDASNFLSRTLANMSLQAFESIYTQHQNQSDNLQTAKSPEIILSPLPKPLSKTTSSENKTLLRIQSDVNIEDAQGFIVSGQIKFSVTMKNRIDLGFGYGHSLLSSLLFSEKNIDIFSSQIKFSLGYQYNFFENISMIPQINIGNTKLLIQSKNTDEIDSSSFIQSYLSFALPIFYTFHFLPSLSLYAQPSLSIHTRSHRFYIDSQEIYYYGYTHFSFGAGICYGTSD